MYKFIFFGQFSTDYKKKLLITLKLVGLGLLIHLFFAMIKSILSIANIIEINTHPTVSLINSTNSFYTLSIIFLLSVIIHPLIEELSFRLLLKPGNLNSLLGIGFLAAFMLLIFTKIHEKFDFNNEVTFDILFLLIAIAVAFAINGMMLKTEFNLNKFIDSRLPFFIFVTSLLFSISHIFVIDSSKSFLIYIVLLLPYFFIGYILSYARLSLGFFYGFLCHALNNLFFYTLNVAFS